MTCFLADSCAWALFIIRLLVGITFVFHGLQMVFGAFGGQGLKGFAQYVTTTLGFPAFLAYCAAFIELIGGALLVLGIASEVAALLLIPVMLVAIVKVHSHNGFFVQNGGCEYPLNLLILLVVIIIAGPGKASLVDIRKGCHREMVGMPAALSPEEKVMMSMVQTMTPEEQRQFFTEMMREVEEEATKLPPEEQAKFIEEFWSEVEREAAQIEK